jgi:exopolysaccharide biosynthesis protein
MKESKLKKLVPAWLLIAIDLVIIAIYAGGFYRLYYLTPRQLSGTGVKTNTADQAYLPEEGDSGITEIVDTEKGGTEETADTMDTPENLRTKFTDHFTDTITAAKNTYTSKDISIEVNKYTQGSDGNIVTYYVADIYLADIKCLQSGFAKDTYGIGYADELINMDKSLGAILAINGDYYGNGTKGAVIRNGEVYRKENNDSDVCVLYYDGTMKTYAASDFNIDKAISAGAYQAWSFGPRLLDDHSSAMKSFTTNSHIKEENPRTAIGYYEPGHYAFVVVDGRQSGYSYGLTLTQFSKLFEKLGCKAAYNLDGGKSSEMTFSDVLVNRPAGGGREISDCIIIKEVQ